MFVSERSSATVVSRRRASVAEVHSEGNATPRAVESGGDARVGPAGGAANQGEPQPVRGIPDETCGKLQIDHPDRSIDVSLRSDVDPAPDAFRPRESTSYG